MPSSFLQKMEFRRLRDNDMKNLVRILRRYPAESDEYRTAKYHNHIKSKIQALPRRLRSWHPFTKLCSLHKGLNHNVINDLWDWVHYELDGAIGKFLYPLIVSEEKDLSEQTRLKLRCLEPVMQMWKKNPKTDESGRPEYDAIHGGSKWYYQQDQCPACMLARIGSDENVLFALFAGMIGSHHVGKLPTLKTLNIIAGFEKPDPMTGFEKHYSKQDKDVSKQDNAESRRIRFACYWLMTTQGRGTTLLETFNLGCELRQLREKYMKDLQVKVITAKLKRLEKKQKAEQQRLTRLQTITSVRPSLDGTTALNTPRSGAFVREEDTGLPRAVSKSNFEPAKGQGRNDDVFNINVDVASPHLHHQWPPRSPNDAKLGPEPRQDDAPRLSPAAKLGFNMLSPRQNGPPPLHEHPVFRNPHLSCDNSTFRPPSLRPLSNLLSNFNDDDNPLTPEDSISCVGMRAASPEDNISNVGMRPAPLQVPQRPAPVQSQSPTTTIRPVQSHPDYYRYAVPDPDERGDSVLAPRSIIPSHYSSTASSHYTSTPGPTVTSSAGHFEASRYIPTIHAASEASAYTINSYTDPSASSRPVVDCLDHSAYNLLETPEETMSTTEELVEKYRRLLAAPAYTNPFADEGYADEELALKMLPKPPRHSIYGAFGNGAFDGGRFDDMDEEIEEEEGDEDSGIGDMRAEQGKTDDGGAIVALHDLVRQVRRL